MISELLYLVAEVCAGGVAAYLRLRRALSEGQELKPLAGGVFKVLNRKDIWKLTQISQPKGEDSGAGQLSESHS